MSDVLTPSERRDAVVFAGIDRDTGEVQFIKVYAVDEEKAREALEEYMNAMGLFPADYRMVSSGLEDVGRKSAITTRSEAKLSAALSRLGLKLYSNGVLYVGELGRVYQLTLMSDHLYGMINRSKKGEGTLQPDEGPFKGFSLGFLLSLGVDVLVENLGGVDLSTMLPDNAVLLREPSPERVAGLLYGRHEGPVVVETKRAERYKDFEFAIFVRVLPLSPEEFASKLSSKLGFEVSPERFKGLPDEMLNLRCVDSIAKLSSALMSRGIGGKEALDLALKLNRRD